MPFKSLIILLIWGSFALGQKNDLVLVTAKTSVINELERDQLQDIFLGKLKNVSGVFVTPVLYDEKEIQSEFVEFFLHRSLIQFARTWQKLIFTGKSQRLTSFQKIDELVQYLNEKEGALSYIPQSKLTNDLKVVKLK